MVYGIDRQDKETGYTEGKANRRGISGPNRGTGNEIEVENIFGIDRGDKLRRHMTDRRRGIEERGPRDRRLTGRTDRKDEQETDTS